MFRIKATEVNMDTGESIETYRFIKGDGHINDLCRDIDDIIKNVSGLYLSKETITEMINGTHKYRTIKSGDVSLVYNISSNVYSITINNTLAIHIHI